MPKLIVVTPNQQMYDIAQMVVSRSSIPAKVLRATSENVVEMVQGELGDATGVVVARGNHAHLLKTRLHIPVVDIVLTGQDIALLLYRACQQLQHPHPRIAFIGFRYMFSNCEPIAQLVGAEVNVFYASNSQEIPTAVQRAQEAGAEMIIGGEIACQTAEQLGLLSLFMDSMTESMVNAVRTATHTLEALETEHQKTAEFMSLLDYSFDVILKLDRSGRVVLGNYRVEKTLRCQMRELTGLHFMQLPGMHASPTLEEALAQHKSLYATVIGIGDDSYVANVASINVDGRCDGFIVSMQEFGAIDDLEEKVRAERRGLGHIAKAVFADYRTESALMSRLLDDAQQYAQYGTSLLLTGEPGADQKRLAECVHNASLYARNPFVTIDLSTISAVAQTEQLFGAEDQRNLRGLLSQAQKGTVFFQHIDLLTEESSRQLLNILKNGQYQRMGMRTEIPISVRVICSTHQPMDDPTAWPAHLAPLCEMLSQRMLRLPPLRERAEDIPRLISRAMDHYSTKYRKHPSFSAEALAWLIRYPWPGNELQLEHFCESAIMLAHSNLLDEGFVREHLPGPWESPEPRRPLVISSPEERVLREALAQCQGDRAATAKLLGFSRTTLWRRLKKYGLEA